MRGGLALVREIGRENHLANDAVGRTLQQPLEADLLRPDAVERRQPTHQHEIQPRIRLRLLDHQQVGGRLDDAQLCRIALARPAKRAERVFGERVAAFAVMNGTRCRHERLRQPQRAVAVMLQQVQRHPLRGLRPDTGQAAQRARQLVEARQRLVLPAHARIAGVHRRFRSGLRTAA